jgi:hypothetical protein
MIASQGYQDGPCFTPPKASTHRTEGFPAKRDPKIACNEETRSTMDSPDGSVLLGEFCAAHLLDHLFRVQRGLICGFSGLRPVVGDKKLIGTRSAYFAYPDELCMVLEWWLKEAAHGREAYFCGHLLTERRRVKENAAPLSALYVDGDGAKVSPALLAPTATVESSPGREHFYWGLTEPVTPQFGELLNRRLALAMGADKAGWDLTQLLRPPGTRNYKYAGAPIVRILELRDERYDPMELDRLLPPLSQEGSKERAPKVCRPKDIGPTPDLSRLSHRMRTLIRYGNRGDYPSRSEADIAVCVAMFAAGYEVAEVWTVMTDRTNGISAKFAEKGRDGERYLEVTISKAQAYVKSGRRRIRVKPPKVDPVTRRKVVIRVG